MIAVWMRLFRGIVRLASGEAVDLRTPHAQATFASVCEAAAQRGRIALTITGIRELAVVAGVIGLARLRPLLPERRLYLPDIADACRGLRIGVRSLLRSHPGYLAMAIFVLAVAVGVNLLVFTIVNALWIRPMPFPDPERVVTVTERTWTRLEAPQLRIFAGGIAGQLDATGWNAGLRPKIDIGGRFPETLGVTSGYFNVLQLPIRGRDFSPGDELEGAEPVAIISDRLWSVAFARRDDVIGAVVPTQPVSLRVIGVAPPDFSGARRGEQVDVWIPTAVVRRLAPPDWKGPLSLMVLGRLGPDQNVAMADQRFWELLDPRDREFLEALEIRMARRPRVVSVADVFGTPDTRTFMINERDGALVVSGLALLVLLGGCATIAALVLVHYERRRAELAVKMSLGAGRGRLIREMLRDLSLVGIAGTAGGLLVAALGTRAIPAMSLPGGVDIGRLDLSIDWRVCAVAGAATLGTLFLAAIFPLARATRPRLASELVGNASSTTLASQRARQALLALQVCATIIVLVSAGLFVRAVVHGFGGGPGFDVDRTVFVSIQERAPWNTGSGYRPEANVQRIERLRQALREIPGVEEVADGLPPIGSGDRFVIKKLKAQDRELDVSAAQLRGSPEMLSVLGVPIVRGRSLTAADPRAAPHAAVITESLARRLWPDGDPLGQPLRAPVSRYGPFTVVGIARDFAFGSLTDPGEGAVITAQPNLNGVTSSFIVRTEQPVPVAAAISRTIEAQVVTVATGRETVARDIGRQRLGAWFFAGFGLAALVLGVGGAFGLVAYLAESQRKEFGVRVALGASMGHIVRRSLAAALLPVAAGVACGLFAAALVSRLFTSLLTGISPLDGPTYVAVAVTTLGCTAIAALAASWRLRRTNPADALRAS
jgi:putative ABC transport system permease protein